MMTSTPRALTEGLTYRDWVWRGLACSDSLMSAQACSPGASCQSLQCFHAHTVGPEQYLAASRCPQALWIKQQQQQQN